jgi:hypothetical protein
MAGVSTARPDRATAVGAAAAALWLVFCVAWFDAGAPWRPTALAAVPRLAWLVPVAVATARWLRGRWPALRGDALGAGEGRWLLLVVALALFFRLPVVLAGAGVAVTSDGALSGIVALHARDGLERLVFVPMVPYSGSLKSHLTAPLALLIDPAVAFALVSVLFYLAYVAGLFRLARLLAGPRAALLAGLYAAFSPAFVTRYSLSNDGNYVEVLAFAAWALWLAARWPGEAAARPRLALAAGLLLGLGFWCHILAIIPLAALAAFFVLVARLGAARSLVALALGWAVGYGPGWLWNAGNDWESFHYLLPGQARTDAAAGASGLESVTAGLGEKAWLMVTDHWPVLMGYDTGYGPLVDRALLALAWFAVACALGSAAWVARRAWRERSWPLSLPLLFGAANLAIALVALAHVPGNPRYILFLMCVIPVLLADALGRGRWRVLLFVLIATGAVASFAQVPGTLRADARWRQFVSDMEREGVRYCYTDFFLATRVNFLSGERIVCTAKLGPITTEYFFSYRERVEKAPEAAFVAVNRTSAGRLGARLTALGVTYDRLDLMKPVLTRLSRKVDPEELFPGREFPMR